MVHLAKEVKRGQIPQCTVIHGHYGPGGGQFCKGIFIQMQKTTRLLSPKICEFVAMSEN